MNSPFEQINLAAMREESGETLDVLKCAVLAAAILVSLALGATAHGAMMRNIQVEIYQ